MTILNPEMSPLFRSRIEYVLEFLPAMALAKMKDGSLLRSLLDETKLAIEKLLKLKASGLSHWEAKEIVLNEMIAPPNALPEKPLTDSQEAQIREWLEEQQLPKSER